MLRSGEWKKRSTAVVDREGERQCVLVACQHADRAPVTSSLSLSLVLSALRLLFSFRSIHAETRPRWLCSSVHAATQLSFPLALTFSGTHDIMSSACAPSRSPSSRRPPPSKAPTVDRTRSRNRGSLAAFCDRSSSGFRSRSTAYNCASSSSSMNRVLYLVGTCHRGMPHAQRLARSSGSMPYILARRSVMSCRGAGPLARLCTTYRRKFRQHDHSHASRRRRARVLGRRARGGTVACPRSAGTLVSAAALLNWQRSDVR